MTTLRVYRDRASKWRWRIRAANGKTIACSGESFASKRNAERAAVRVDKLLRQGVVLIVDGTP